MGRRLRVHLDPCGGIAGDMFCAALAHARPDLRDDLLLCLSRLALPPGIEPRFEAHIDHSLAGLRFVVPLARTPESGEMPASQGDRQHRHEHAHGHGHEHDPGHGHHHHEHSPPHGYARHGHVPHARIRDMLTRSALAPAVRMHALAIFALLAEAEARVHAVPVDQVEFHEVGAWDSIVDIVAAAFWIDALDAVSWSHEPVPLGRGTARTAHGLIPLPAPATLHLLEGIEVVDDGIGGERATPTGAAILRYLRTIGSVPAIASSRMRPLASGYGMGTRSLPGRANALRATLYEYESREVVPTADHVLRIDFDIDDQSGEDLAVALDILRARSDVLQVVQWPVFGKKGRLGMRIELLALEQAQEAVIAACFEQTTTIGLRVQDTQRRLLARREVCATADAGPVRVKLCERAASHTAKAEMDDLALRATNHAQREALRRNAETQALQGPREPPEGKP